MTISREWKVNLKTGLPLPRRPALPFDALRCGLIIEQSKIAVEIVPI